MKAWLNLKPTMSDVVISARIAASDEGRSSTPAIVDVPVGRGCWAGRRHAQRSIDGAGRSPMYGAESKASGIVLRGARCTAGTGRAPKAIDSRCRSAAAAQADHRRPADQQDRTRDDTILNQNSVLPARQSKKL
jgi:hypothetical protein